MANSSNLASLSATLAAKAESDRQLIEAQTSEQLRLHAESLQQLSSDALASTKSAMASQSKAAIKSLTEVKTQIEEQSQALSAEIEKQTKRLLWLIKWPLLGTLAVCLIICLMTWGYWLMSVPWTTSDITEESGKRWTKQVLNSADWRPCHKKEPDGTMCRWIPND